MVKSIIFQEWSNQMQSSASKLAKTDDQENALPPIRGKSKKVADKNAKVYNDAQESKFFL